MDKISNQKVIVYSTPTCMYCKMAKDFFRQNKVEFIEHDVAADLKAREEMLEKSGQMGVPVIDVGGEVIVGFDRDRLAELLDIKD